MELLKHFIEEKAEFYILRLNHTEMEVFLSKIPLRFRTCYVSDNDLKTRAKNLRIPTIEVIKSYIPDVGNVMSGEFGEILSYHLLKEMYLPLKIDGPPKWRWKEDKNKPIQKTDVILFHRNKKKPSSKDFLVSAEIKSKATNNRSYDPIQDAVDGARKDKISRLGKTLVWLRDKYIQDNNADDIEYIQRFIDSVEYGTYEKYYKAIAIIDQKLSRQELQRKRNIENLDADFEIIVICIKDLKTVYETTYKNLLVLGCDD